ncbi:LysR family transcriptional regulator [Chitiniphilus purpureus]|uniref:LysR family transcriptional regulator n=1 Tax=Chitiniphilus purpureus TaxID=2981137 RepID=A0ABY6DPT8_9NEIS|nr:LysR family transcriptional regulator [Chitiniphilus sp. CD1]UXY16037.1 LysR family transcriptional regulator [Chitiniphilus sp. CD1]
MRYTLRQLEIFVAVGRLENVSNAARELNLSQSATSTALGEFERQFNCQLFDRVGKTLQLNTLGRRLLPRAAALIDQAREIEALLEGREGFGALHIGATLTIGNYLATILISQFMQRHPESRVKLDVHNTATVIQQVADYALDLGLIEGESHHPALEVERWVADELVVFANPEHPLARRGSATVEALLAEPWILREHGSGTRETFDHAFRPHRPRLNVRLELEHTEAIKRAVESGLGIGCISRLALREAFRRGSLAPIEVPELDLRRQFHFVWHKQKYQTPGMREFLALCRGMTEGVQRSDEIALPYIP